MLEYVQRAFRRVSEVADYMRVEHGCLTLRDYPALCQERVELMQVRYGFHFITPIYTGYINVPFI